MTRPLFLAAALLACHPAPAPVSPTSPAGSTVTVTLAPGVTEGPLTGRLLVILTPRAGEEPRALVGSSDDTAQVFGMDVKDWSPGRPIALAADADGYPQARLADLPAGALRVEALFHRYETFKRGDGHTVDLPPDRGEGQQWAEAPGNLVSAVALVRLPGPIELTLDHLLPPIEPVVDTPLVRHVEIESPRLTKFWGRPMKLGARVLLPAGWDSHPQAHYPLLIAHGHFTRDITGYRETPPDAALPPYDLEGLKRECPNGHEGDACVRLGYRRYMQEAGYRFYQQWNGKGFPRVILVQIEHANPYYDDSYAVNSDNVGPYGDAITYELIPELEKRFRGLGPWARGMYGGSTGGWEALAAQIFYPDEYNGAVGNCPDPIDFRAYVTIDLYADDNAFYSSGRFRRTPRTGSRTPDGRLASTVEQDNQLEAALGSHSRSGGQWDIWEAVYSPAGDDGYPRRIFDKKTGVIDKQVAAHWRDHYDLGHILTRDWARLGPKLRGKLWINVGDLDSYFLERSVRLVDARLEALGSDAVVTFGHGDGHCWSGDREHLNLESRLTYHSRFIPLLVEHFLKSAPPGADTTSWRY